MDAIDEELASFEQAKGTDDNWLRICPIGDAASANRKVRSTLASFQAFPVEKRALLPFDNRRPTGFLLSRNPVEFGNLRHRRSRHRSRAAVRYSSETSIPMDLRPKVKATRLVVPVPLKGSSTTPSSGQVARMGSLHKSSG